MRSHGLVPSDHLYHKLIMALGAAEEYDAMFRLWDEYLQTGMRPPQQVRRFRSRSTRWCSSCGESLSCTTNSFAPTQQGFNAVILAYSKAGHFDKALQVSPPPPPPALSSSETSSEPQ
jgi:hypothetical protein